MLGAHGVLSAGIHNAAREAGVGRDGDGHGASLRQGAEGRLLDVRCVVDHRPVPPICTAHSTVSGHSLRTYERGKSLRFHDAPKGYKAQER